MILHKKKIKFHWYILYIYCIYNITYFIKHTLNIYYWKWEDHFNTLYIYTCRIIISEKRRQDTYTYVNVVIIYYKNEGNYENPLILFMLIISFIHKNITIINIQLCNIFAISYMNFVVAIRAIYHTWFISREKH